jgi:hypothetical protein
MLLAICSRSRDHEVFSLGLRVRFMLYLADSRSLSGH